MRYSCLVAAMVAGLMAAPLSGQSVRAGIEAWQNSDYAAAVVIWRPLAEKGDADAAFNLGQAYRLGRGVPRDLAAAQDWFERAARKDHLDAQAMLGLLLLQTGNQSGGLRWLKLAAQKGEPRAMLAYGAAIFNGDGVPRDPLLGYAYVNGAAEQDLEPARRTLAQLDQILPAEEREKARQIDLATVDRAAEKPAPKKAMKVASVASTPKAPPKGIVEPTTATPPSGRWRIQLGAFSNRNTAEALFDKLSRSAALSGRNAFYVPFGSVTRMQVGPFASQAAAQAACSALKPQPCFPVAAR